MESIEGDVCDPEAVAAAVAQANPEVVIHMAAQSLVRRSFSAPRETYETNVMGTVNVLDAVRVHGSGVRAIRDLRQVLRESRVGVGLSRARADGGLRSLF
jgi:CDP-glucose 4,6-dehydratase